MLILYMGIDETLGDETKTTIKIPTDLLDEFKHLAIDMKTTVTALIIEAMRQYLKDIKKK
jgi:predicted transcriptional regulator